MSERLVSLWSVGSRRSALRLTQVKATAHSDHFFILTLCAEGQKIYLYLRSLIFFFIGLRPSETNRKDEKKNYTYIATPVVHVPIYVYVYIYIYILVLLPDTSRIIRDRKTKKSGLIRIDPTFENFYSRCISVSVLRILLRTEMYFLPKKHVY